MSMIQAADTGLSWEVLTIERRGFTRDTPAGKQELKWVANSSMLIAGEPDAVLVDTFLTTAQSQIMLDFVVASGKNLSAIYITHGHAEHFFGLAPLRERFPLAKAYATPDTANSTSLHVPSNGLIVAWDVVYNGIHPYLGETDAQSRRERIAALDKLEALKRQAVVAGHKIPENDDDPRDIGRTRDYLSDFNRLFGATTSARGLYDEMLKLHSHRVNPVSLWSGAKAAHKVDAISTALRAP